MVLLTIWTLWQKPVSQVKYALSREWKHWNGIWDLLKVSKALQGHYNLFKVNYKCTRVVCKICSKSTINILEQCVKFVQSQ